MKIRTLEELSDHLDGQEAWRKRELAFVHRLLLSRAGTPGEASLVRSALALLYAHWEGFIKAAGDAYVHFISRQSLRYDQLASPFLAVSLKGRLLQTGGSERTSAYLAVAEFVTEGLGDASRLPRKDAVNTRANLNSEVLRDVVAELGLDFAPYETKAHLIDQRLVKNRNRIAHGKYLQIGRPEYLEVYKEVLGLLDLFRKQIQRAAEAKAYLRRTG